MNQNYPALYVEINRNEYIFIVSDIADDDNYKIIYFKKIPIKGIVNNKIQDLNLVTTIIKENIYLAEQKTNYTFKEAILIINNFTCSSISLSGFKKLNGIQLSKDHVSHLLNSIKTNINEIETKKKIIHIFNSKFFLDNKEIENMPIGLFGNFYSQEIFFYLIDNNDHKNLKVLFDRCNLRIKRILSKNFLEGAHIAKNNLNSEIFFKIRIDKTNTEIFYFENLSLKFFQTFKFGTDLIINDISKIIALDVEKVKDIIINSDFSKKNIENDLIEKRFFIEQNFRKIKKKLVNDIADARIHEIIDLVILNNINLKSFVKKKLTIFIEVCDQPNFKSFRNCYEKSFAKFNNIELKFIENFQNNDFNDIVNTIVQYGWKNEAIPIISKKKSLFARLFDLISN